MTSKKSGENEQRAAIEALALLAKFGERGLTIAESLVFVDFLYQHEKALSFIEQYDRKMLEVVEPEKNLEYILLPETATTLIDLLRQRLAKRGENVTHFGRHNTGSLDAVIGCLYQTSGGKELLPGVEKKAANLLYLLVKDHCFVDGNKRIAAFLFVWYLGMNRMLYTAPNEPIVSHALLYKLTIFIAESDPKHKDLIVDLVSKVSAFPNEVPPDAFWLANMTTTVTLNPTPEDQK